MYHPISEKTTSNAPTTAIVQCVSAADGSNEKLHVAIALLPRTEKFSLELPLDVIDIPQLSMHQGHGQREGNYNGFPHARRLMLRKIRQHPLGFLRFIGKQARLELAARRRARTK